MIYLDPPFNSNQDYAAPVGSKAAGAAFKDAWTLSDLDVAWMGLIADEKPALAHMLNAAGHSHGKGMQSYLTMMAVRLLEMRRVLKDTGSIYLHCDPTASHYLKQLMDAISGRGISGTRLRGDALGPMVRRNALPLYTTRSSSTRDLIAINGTTQSVLVYEASRRTILCKDGYGLANQLLRECPNRLWATRNGESGEPWKGVDPNAKGRHWAIPKRLVEEVPEDLTGLTQHQKLDRLFELGFIHIGEGYKWPIYEHTITPDDGQPMPDLWAFQPYTEGTVFGTEGGIDVDVHWLATTDMERIGYPTQKPLALLERIIKASSNEGDIVLDPFCGCATACVAAEKLGREWLGIDLSAKAVELVNVRLQGSMGSLFHKPPCNSPYRHTQAHWT